MEADMGKRYLAGLGLALSATLVMVQFIGCAKDQVSGLSQAELARRRAAAEMAARRAAAARRMELLRQKFYNEGVRVVIQGNCDERGSRAYNLALGDRRAKAAKRYLIQLGIAASRMRTVSFGKDRPLCTEHNETCWQRNRRAHFIDQ
jgi:flagellar motor protein MotB